MALKSLLAATAVAALAFVPAAAAHENEEGLTGYTATIETIDPQPTGLDIAVIGGDEALEMTNGTGKKILILGYGGEPYLRIEPEGVFVNRRSPAAYLNEDRFGETKVPADASTKAEPLWKQVAHEPVWEWHDHRIHWMSPIAPPKIAADPGKAQHVNDWKVSGTIDGAPLTIAGSLDYV